MEAASRRRKWRRGGGVKEAAPLLQRERSGVKAYFAVINHADAKDGWAKNLICNFVTKASEDETIPVPHHIS